MTDSWGKVVQFPPFSRLMYVGYCRFLQNMGTTIYGMSLSKWRSAKTSILVVLAFGILEVFRSVQTQE